MPNDRPIKMHLDEEMREHIAFVLRRYMNEMDERKYNLRNPNFRFGGRTLTDEERRHKIEKLQESIDLTHMCLKEAMEAGT